MLSSETQDLGESRGEKRLSEDADVCNIPRKKRSRNELPARPKELKLYSFKRGKTSLAQPSFNLPGHPITVKFLSLFHSYRDQLKDNEFPEEFLSLIAVLIQESDLDLDGLAKHILDTLYPKGFCDDREIISLDAIKGVINELAERRNYGLSISDNPSIIGSKQEFWIWEVKSISHIPEPLVEKILMRRAEREKAVSELRKYFGELSDEDKCLFTGVIADSKPQELKMNPPITKKRLLNSPKNIKSINENSQKILMGFFKKVEKLEKKEDDVPECSFQKLFPSYQLSRDTTLADYNRFYRFIPDTYIDDFLFKDENRSLKDLVKELSEAKRHAKPLSCPRIINHIEQCENYSNSLSRCQKIENKGKCIPLKLFQYHDSIRPAYWGRYSKSSNIVTGRNPLAKDTNIISYDVNSEEEWEAQSDLGEELKSEEDTCSEENKFTGSYNNRASDECSENTWVVPNGYLSDEEIFKSDNSAHEPMNISTNKSSPKWCVNKPLVHRILGPYINDADYSEVEEFRAMFIVKDLKLEDFFPSKKEINSNPSKKPRSEEIEKSNALFKWFKPPKVDPNLMEL